MMNIFRRRQDNRRKKTRPEGRVASFWHGIISLVFYCILNEAADGDHEREVVREPSAGITSINSSSPERFTTDILTDHRRTNHEPNPCLACLSSSIAHSSSVDRSQEGKGDGQPNTPSKKKKNWFSWFKKGSEKNKVAEKLEKEINDGSAAAVSVKPEKGLSESSFKILQLTASPGGARKAPTSRFCSQLARRDDKAHEKVAPSFENTAIDVDQKSLDGSKHRDTMKTFSLSDVSSSGVSETADESSSFTGVTLRSLGELSDYWGLSDGQLPPSISSTSTGSFTDDEAGHIQVSSSPAVEVTMSVSSYGSESEDTPVESHDLKSKEIPTTCSSGCAATAEDIVDATAAPSTAVQDQETPSCDRADIPGDSDASTSTDIAASTDAPNTVDASDSTDRIGEEPGRTMVNIFALIVRTLNLGVAKFTDAAPRDTCSIHDNKTHHRPSTTTAAALPDTGYEKNTSEVPEHTTPSLHKLHTEWPKHHVNIEVLLGIKPPKNSFEALAVQKFMEDETSNSANDVTLKTGAVTTPTEKDQSLRSIEAESEMAVDSGIGSRGDCMHSEP